MLEDEKSSAWLQLIMHESSTKHNKYAFNLFLHHNYAEDFRENSQM